VFNDVLSEFHSRYADVVIILLNHLSVPVCSWTVSRALPVKWHMGDLDANSNAILINTLELNYSEMHWLGVKA
jgi:phage tail-like protein